MSIIKSYVVPHPPLAVSEVGRGEEKQIERTIDSYKKIGKEISELKPDTIIITSPHTECYSDYFHISPGKSAFGSFSMFGASSVTFNEEYDEELVNELNDYCEEIGFPAGTEGEKNRELDHGTMVPLYFIEQFYKDFKLVRIGISGLSYYDHYKLGQIINEVTDKLHRRVVFVASGDLSHKLQEYGPYGFIAEGPIYDKKVMDSLSRGAFDELLRFDPNFVEKASVCGHKSFIIMSGSLDGINVHTDFYSHEDVTGVGYGILSFEPLNEDSNRLFLDIELKKEKEIIKEKRNNADQYVLLAIDSIYEYINNGNILKIPNTLNNELLNEQRGVFVSIHKYGELRGCIGTINPIRDNIAEEIIFNAISASTKDNRFSPITSSELDYLDINVDVLMDPEEIDSKDMLDVKKYGVIVSSGFKRGLLLPDIEGIDNVDQQIEIAMRKGNIYPDEDIKLKRFEVIRHK